MQEVEKMSLLFSSKLCSQYLTSAHAPMEMDTQVEGSRILPFQRELQWARPTPLSAHGIPDPWVWKIMFNSTFSQCRLNYSFQFRSLKRENPDLNEDVVLIRALRDSNLPKFLTDDALLFR